LALALQTR